MIEFLSNRVIEGKLLYSMIPNTPTKIKVKELLINKGYEHLVK